jgi:hypothetical protein
VAAPLIDRIIATRYYARRITANDKREGAPPGETYQFNWSHETITLQGLPLTIKATHMKTAVEAIFVGKARQYNRHFPRICLHHLIEPVA